MSVPSSALVPRALVPLTLGSFAYFLSVGMAIPAVPGFVTGELGGGTAAAGVAVGAFSAVGVLGRPAAGRALDRWGPRRVILAGAAVATASLASYPGAPGPAAFVVLRALHGAAEAAFAVGVVAEASAMAPPDRHGRTMSHFSIGLYLGLALGPVLGSQVADAGGPHALWLVAATCTLIGGALAAVVVRPRAAGVGPEATTTWRSAAAPAVAPAAVLAVGLLGLGAFSTLVPLHASAVGLSPAAVFAVYGGAVLAVRILGASIPDRAGHQPAARAALLGVAGGMGLFAAWDAPAGVIGGAVVFAVGVSLAFPALLSLALAEVRGDQRGAVVGVMTAAFEMPQAVGAPALAAVAESVGFAAAFTVAAAAGLVGLLALELRHCVPLARRRGSGPTGEAGVLSSARPLADTHRVG